MKEISFINLFLELDPHHLKEIFFRQPPRDHILLKKVRKMQFSHFLN